jgi:hypothetical protein
MKRVAEAAASRSAIRARSVSDDLVVFPVSGLLYFKRRASHNAPDPVLLVGRDTPPSRGQFCRLDPDPVAAGRSGHASIGGEFCRLGCVSDTASTAPKLGGDQPLRQIGF